MDARPGPALGNCKATWTGPWGETAEWPVTRQHRGFDPPQSIQASVSGLGRRQREERHDSWQIPQGIVRRALTVPLGDHAMMRKTRASPEARPPEWAQPRTGARMVAGARGLGCRSAQGRAPCSGTLRLTPSRSLAHTHLCPGPGASSCLPRLLSPGTSALATAGSLPRSLPSAGCPDQGSADVCGVNE